MNGLVVIDDNPMEHMIIQRIVEKYHIFPDIAFSPDAKIILDFIHQHRFKKSALPDLIFLDLNMPGYDGWQFLEDFEKTNPVLKKKIAVYIYSSSIDPEEKRRALNYPFVHGFLHKPITPVILVNLYAQYEPAKLLAG